MVNEFLYTLIWVVYNVGSRVEPMWILNFSNTAF